MNFAAILLFLGFAVAGVMVVLEFETRGGMEPLED